MDIDSETRRRQIRMRKILENSESRLKKITNVSENEVLEEGMAYFDIKYLNECTQSALVEEEKEISNVTPETAIPSTSNKPPLKSLQTIFNNPQADTQDSVSEIELIQSGYLTRNYFIIFLSVIVRCLYLLGNFFDQLTYSGVNKIFMPLLMFEVIEYVFFKPFIPESGALNILFMLNNRIKPEYLVKVLWTFRLVTRVLQDLMMYFFVFVCFDKVLTTLTF